MSDNDSRARWPLAVHIVYESTAAAGPESASPAELGMDERKRAEYAKMEAKLSVKRVSLDDPDAQWAVSALRKVAAARAQPVTTSGQDDGQQTQALETRSDLSR